MCYKILLFLKSVVMQHIFASIPPPNKTLLQLFYDSAKAVAWVKEYANHKRYSIKVEWVALFHWIVVYQHLHLDGLDKEMPTRV